MMPANKKRFDFSVIAIMLAAFLAYTGMYAVRKSFLAGQYNDLDLGYGLNAKTILVISQVLGYMLSKFIGIRIISEMPKQKRIPWLLCSVLFGLLALGLFAWLPGKLKLAAMFLNGLPLGMVFGLVFSYIEGRKNTEMLAAALSATFIFATGLVKTTGIMLMNWLHITEYAMPLVTGLAFMPFFLLAVFMLNRSKEPDSTDLQQRTERVPMFAADRKRFLQQNGMGYFGLVTIYIILTIVRDFRDNFAVEFWSENGFAKVPSVITLTEIPVAVVVLVIAAMGILIRNNLKAFNTGMWLAVMGSAAVLISTLLFRSGYMDPVSWTIVTGIGIYLPYILFHCLLFERLLALLGYKGNVGFLFYVADSLGYLGSVVVMLMKEVFHFNSNWSGFFVQLNIICAIGIAAFALFTIWYFARKFHTKNKAQGLPVNLTTAGSTVF